MNKTQNLNLNKNIIKVYVGSAIEQWIAYKVLEYSIRKHTNVTIIIKPLYENNITWNLPKKKENHPKTPFSFHRFLIPELNQFTGKAIYVDSDMLVFTDILDLWSREMNDIQIYSVKTRTNSERKPQFSVMLMNCDYFKPTIQEIIQALDDGVLTYKSLMSEMKIAKKIQVNIEHEWNSLEYYESNKTKLLHYTDMNRQPWLFNNNQLSYLWIKELSTAIEEKFISIMDLKREIKKGRIKPSLLFQIKKNHFDNITLPKFIKLLDRFFIPPHHRINGLTLRHKIYIFFNKLIQIIIYPIILLFYKKRNV